MAFISEIVQETPAIRTSPLVWKDPAFSADFSFQPGQVGQVSVFGVGESTFVINSPPTRKEYLQFSVMRTGEVTRALHQLNVGDMVGVRAPLENSFPHTMMKGRDNLFIGGGIGMAPLRTLLQTTMDNRADFGDITVIYGARSPQDLCYRYEFDEWRAAGVNLVLTVDREHPGRTERVGFVPTILAEEAPSPFNRVAVTCGPPIMIKFVLAGLKKLGYEDDQFYTTLERRMKCGIGLCGRCNIGGTYVCVDGPVFSGTALRAMPPEL
ncbi:MAG: FAD/NAD(P)-binding protein [Desulfosoma sp.]|uniref:FAD/NAD(P)-binding protein n=1 Tax=Desulfosoma sp. TaxID=2603217 RepID=UPI00404AC13B